MCVVCVTDGNEDDVFSIDPENGNVIIAHQLDWETRSRYNLTIMATDGSHRIYTEVCGCSCALNVGPVTPVASDGVLVC